MAVQAALPKSRKPIRWHWWWLPIVLVVLLVLGVMAFAIFKPIKVLPRIRLSPGFILTDQNGKQLSNEDLRGQVVLYNFLYTGCGEKCDQLNDTMRQVQDGLNRLDLGDMPVKLVTISFDPDRDTPDVLRSYARSIGADPTRWNFATGDPARLKQVIGSGFEAYYAPDAEGGFQFDPAFILVDGWGIIRKEYRYQTEVPDAQRILNHVGILAEEVSKSKGAGRLAYEAAHLFLCYAH